jgi:hypothetical protein
MRKIALSLTAFAALFCLVSSAAQAQATRTWVSGVGDDANPCSRTAPCKTFAGAISKTAPSGEINVLDPGGFGAVTITKAISIVSEGNIAGVLVSGTNGIIISAGTNDVVTLRGLDINGLGTGLSGIKFLSGKALHVRDCNIFGFTQGIDFEPNQASAQLTVQSTKISENSANGILVQPVSPGSAKVSVDGVHLENNGGDGFKADATNGGISATLRESLMISNGANGIHSFSPGASPSAIMVDHCSTQNNSGAAPNGNGIFSDTGVGSIVRITDVTITGNTKGVNSTGSATIFSFGNNHNAGNGSGGDGTPNP